MPHLNYCQLIWGIGTNTCLQKIYLLQKRALRIIFNLPRDHPAGLLFEKAKVTTIFHVNNLRLAMCHKNEVLCDSDTLSRMAELIDYVKSYPLRQKKQYTLLTPRTNYGTQMLRYRLPTLLNCLSDAGINISSCTKRELCSFLVSVVLDSWPVFCYYVR